MRPVSVFAKALGSEIEQVRGDLHGQWRQATRAVMVLLSLHGLPPAQIAVLLDCHPATVRRWISRFDSEGLAGLADRPRCGRPQLGGRQLTRRIAALLARPGPWTLPHVRASWTPRGTRPQVLTPGTNRKVTVLGAIEVTTAAWVYQLGRRCTADFIALLEQVLQASPQARAIVVICDNDSIHHARKVTAYLGKHPCLELLYGARYSPHDNPAERIWAALKNYVANTAVTWSVPWLPPGYEQNFWNAA